VNEVENELAGSDDSQERMSPGRALRKLREERNLSISDVAQHLKYGVRQIEALEGDDFQNLPGMTFVRGMTRSYAKLLGSDPAKLLSELEQRRLPDQVTVEFRTTQIPFPDGSKRVMGLYSVLSVLFVLVAAVVAYEWQYGGFSWIASDTPQIERRSAEVPEVSAAGHPARDHRTVLESANIPRSVGSEPSAVPDSLVSKQELTYQAAGVTTKAATVNSRIALQFDRESWVEIKQADGKTLMAQLNPQGSRQLVEGTPPFVLIIGNAPNVRLSYNEVPVDLRPHFKVDVARIVLE